MAQNAAATAAVAAPTVARQRGPSQPALRRRSRSPRPAWCEEWWARHAVPNLERQTRTSYKQQWGKWIQPRLGDYELRAPTPRVINTQLVQGDAQGRGRRSDDPPVPGDHTQSMLRLAVVEERVPSNPVDLLDKPSAVPERQVDAIAPAVVESMRRAAIARRGPLGVSDAFIIAMLAYAGLRPQELLALEWDDVLTDVAKLFISARTSTARSCPTSRAAAGTAVAATAVSTCSNRSPPTCARTACGAARAGAW
jgi:integrase